MESIKKLFITLIALLVFIVLVGGFHQSTGYFKEVRNAMLDEDSGVAVDDTSGGIVVSGPVNVEDWPNWTAWIKNAGGGSADDFLDVWVEGSPDGTLWVSLSTAESALESESDALTSGNGGVAMMGSNSSIVWIRLMAVCDTGLDTTADGWISANKN